MDHTFAGRPVFVSHVEGVDESVDEVRKEADGWVVESFFNAADGKHWVKFIVVTDRGFRAIKNGMRLSNAYIPHQQYGKGGLWNGVEYAKEVLGGEYEHLAIVPNPRYEESVIMTPEQFKMYNSEKEIELKRIANSKDQSQKGEKTMGLNFFKRSKVENSADLESTVVLLPESKKELTISELVKRQDKIENMQGYANDDHMVKVGNEEMSVGDLKKKHMDMASKVEEAKKNAESDEGGEPGKGADDDMQNDAEEEGTISAGVKDVGDRGGDKSLDNEEDEEKKKKAEKKENSRAKASALKNAGPLSEPEMPTQIHTSYDAVQKGKARYGSN